MTANRHTQSVALTPAEADLVREAAKARGLSASGWAHARLASALSTRAAQLAACQDVTAYAARPIKAADRTARVSTILPTGDYEALKALATRERTTAHAISQGVLVTDAERELGGAIQRRARREDERTAAAPEAALPADVVAMLAALDVACWPDRDKAAPSAASSYATALHSRGKVREGMMRLRNHSGRDLPRVELVASAVVEHPTCRDVAAMLCLPIAEVARTIALRCHLNAAKAKPEPQPVTTRQSADELAAMVADALRR